jgi:hypothetical protein
MMIIYTFKTIVKESISSKLIEALRGMIVDEEPRIP